MTNKGLFGLEVECEVNSETIGKKKIVVGGYHGFGGDCCPYWKAEGDGSLRVTKPNFRTVEFISKPFKRNELGKAIASLRTKLGENQDEFKNFGINNSCGAHIHFSFKEKSKNLQMFRTLPLEAMESIRKKIQRNVKRKFPELYPSYKKQYYRSYARRITEQTAKFVYNGDRYHEFNFTRGTGIEFRSFNLLGATKWSQLIGMYEIALDAIEGELKAELKKKHAYGNVLFFDFDPHHINAVKEKETVKIAITAATSPKESEIICAI